MGPSRFTKGELAKVGVEIISESNVGLKCAKCGQTWSPALRSGGKLPARYWQCPNGCNAGHAEGGPADLGTRESL